LYSAGADGVVNVFDDNDAKSVAKHSIDKKEGLSAIAIHPQGSSGLV